MKNATTWRKHKGNASDSCQSPVDWTMPSKNTGAESQGQEMDYIYKQTNKSSNPCCKHPGPWT